MNSVAFLTCGAPSFYAFSLWMVKSRYSSVYSRKKKRKILPHFEPKSFLLEKIVPFLYCSKAYLSINSQLRQSFLGLNYYIFFFYCAMQLYAVETLVKSVKLEEILRTFGERGG